jgi:excisionase family DNA binding protein
MSTIEKLPEVMTSREVAEFLRVSEATVQQYAVRAWLPGRQLGTEWRFSRAAIEEWLRGPSGKEILLGQWGILEDDQIDLAELRGRIYADRSRSEGVEVD